MSEAKAILPVRIYWEDTDAGGIVYHSNYLKFMERARTELLRSLFHCSQTELARQENILFVAVSVNLQWKRSAYLDDELMVHTSIKQLKMASMVFDQKIYRGDTLITTAEVRVAVVQKDTMTPTAMPESLHNAFAQWLQAPHEPSNA